MARTTLGSVNPSLVTSITTVGAVLVRASANGSAGE
jgi:hypothetical protein